MKDEVIVINSDLENQLATIDEEKLPQIFADQVHFLEKANQEYCNAEEKEKQARKKVETALKEADKLIEAAKNVGGHTAKKKKFLWAEWTSKRDEIDALKNNLKEIIDHSEDSAEAQKKLAEVQSSLMESQTAILQVQKAHMEYQRQIANATKFVFGLSAYNIGVSQSIFVNLKAVLSGETPEKMGELAQQQLFLALDQIRNQESLITRIKENENLIESLNSDIAAKQREIDEISELDIEQNRRISENAQDIDALEQQDAEQDKLIAEGIEKDKTQDAQISENAQDIDALEQQDAEHDKLIAEGIEKDKSQDAQIFENAQDIDELERQDAEQDKLIASIFKKVDEQSKTLDNHSKANEELEQKIQELSKSTTEAIATLKRDVEKSNENFTNKISDLSAEFNNAIAKLQGEIKTQRKEINSEVEELKNKVISLNIAIGKKGWKIVISVVAGASLLLNILQLLKII